MTHRILLRFIEFITLKSLCYDIIKTFINFFFNVIKKLYKNYYKWIKLKKNYKKVTEFIIAVDQLIKANF